MTEPGTSTQLQEPLRAAVINLLWLAPVCLLALGTAVLAATNWWSTFGIRPLGTFVDLAQVTYNADCSDPSAGHVGASACDPLRRPYNYPPVWHHALRLLNLGAADTLWLGCVLIASTLVVLAIFYAYFLGTPTRQRLLYATAVTCSPPFVLMLARANTDLLMLAALAGAAMLTASRRAFPAAAVIGLSAGLKLYPVGALIALRGWPRWTAAALSTVAIAWLAGPHLSEIRSSTPSGTYTTFGAGVIPAALRHGWPGTISVRATDQLVGMFVVLTLTAMTMVLRSGRTAVRRIAGSLRSHEGARASFVLGAGTFLTTYLFTTSFDYRLFSLAFIAVACLLVQTDRPQRLLLWLALAGLWLSYPMRGGFQLVGDVVMIGTVVLTLSVTLCLLVTRYPVKRA